MPAVLLACALILPGGLPGGAPRQATADQAELERLERVWNEAHERGDGAALATRWADELTVTVPGMPVMNKADSLAIWRSGRMKLEKYATSDPEIRIFGDAAVVTGRLERRRALADRTVIDDWRFTKVYVRRGGTWLVVAWHASPAGRP